MIIILLLTLLYNNNINCKIKNYLTIMYNMEISIGSYKCRLEIVLVIIFLLFVLFGHSIYASRTYGMLEGFEDKAKPKPVPKYKTEGFSNYKTAAGPQFAENNGNYSYMDPNKWSQPSLVYTAGVTPDAGVQSILDRGKNQAPLASGELNMFANTQFKPECCPNTYSSSLGCACMSTQQYNTLITRGGNNVPFSEY
jgi:hypothetical protein